MQFSNEYIEAGGVVRKADAFTAWTARFREWLKSEFVSWRGPHAFDNADEHLRIFGSKYRRA